jgi:hypothetical protein
VSDLLARTLGSVAAWLDEPAIPWMVAGSFASTSHGQPRATQDVNVVFDPSHEALLQFLDRVPADRVYVDRDAALDALARRDLFNLIDLETGWKVDLIVRKNRPFSRAEVDRRIPARWMGVDLFVASPEDGILSKLEWARLSGGSERQLRDVAGVPRSTGRRRGRRVSRALARRPRRARSVGTRTEPVERRSSQPRSREGVPRRRPHRALVRANAPLFRSSRTHAAGTASARSDSRR